jgi:hypothetical protein
MPPLAWHITSRLYDDRIITPTTRDRRRLARSLLRIGLDSGLLAFGIADTHLHAASVCDRVTAGQLARRAELAAQGLFRYGVPFESARIRPIHDQAHLRNAFWYILRQQQRHDIATDPFFDGSSLPDLLGLRAGSAWIAARVRSHLPRVRGPALLELLGRGVSFERAIGDFTHLRRAAIAAAGLPDLDGRNLPTVRARAAAVRVARPALSARTIAARLGVEPGAVRRLARRPGDPELDEAIRRQLVLRQPDTHPAPEPLVG